MAQIALAWLLHQPAVTSVIIGAKKSESIERQSGVGRREAGAADLEKLDKVSALAPEYPGWMFGMQGSDRRPGQVRDWSRYHAEVNQGSTALRHVTE